MRVQFVEKTTKQIIFTVSIEGFRKAIIYNTKNKSVVCAACAGTSCEHIDFVSLWFNLNNDAQIKNFIQEFTGFYMIDQDFTEMKSNFLKARRASQFNDAVSRKNTRKQKKKNVEPRPSNRFSGLEL